MTDRKTKYKHHYDAVADTESQDVATQDRKSNHIMKQEMKICFVVIIVLFGIVLLIILEVFKTEIDECGKPPMLPDGTLCLYEFEDGRKVFRYSSTTIQNVDTFVHCPVSYYNAPNCWSAFNVSPSAIECYNKSSNGAVYNRKNTCTETGRTCQRWDLDNPHGRGKNNIPNKSEDLHSNYCRDPGPPYGEKTMVLYNRPSNQMGILSCSSFLNEGYIATIIKTCGLKMMR